MRILFASSDGIALETLEKINAGFDLAAVLTNRSISSGRKKTVNPIAGFAVGNNIPLFEFEHLKAEEREIIRGTGADFLLSFSYSHIFGPKFLSLFPAGTLNIHPSALPLYRGPSPIQTALLDNARHSAISFQKIALKMDEGDICKSVPFDIEDEDDFVSLSGRISRIAADNVCDVLENRLGLAVPQTGDSTYTSLFSKEDGKIDFNVEGAVKICGKVRAFCVWPRTYCTFKEKTLFILSAAKKDMPSPENAVPGTVFAYDKKSGCFMVKTIDGTLGVSSLMLEGRKPVSAADFKNGCPEIIGGCLE